MKYYESKYTGAEVDALLGKVESGDVGGKVTVDSALSTESENPVQNKVITEELNKKASSEALSSLGDSVASLESKKADKDGVYSGMTVGRSIDLLGVEDVEEGSFLFRPTDGDGSIKDGVAVVKSVKGDSVVWNQLFGHGATSLSQESWEGNRVTINGTFEEETPQYDIEARGAEFSLPNVGNKCLVIIRKISGKVLSGEVKISTTSLVVGTTLTLSADSTESYKAIFSTFKEGSTYHFYRRYLAGTVCENLVLEYQFIDLTKAFPNDWQNINTIEDFNARVATLCIEDMNAYNEGEVVNMKASGIKSVGFNAWDEEWEIGRYDTTTGEEIASPTVRRNANYIPILPNVQYYWHIPSLSKDVYGGYALFYDRNKKFISQSPMGGTVYSKVQTPSNAAYMNFYLRQEYGTTYNNDICINLVHSGYRNGEYEPYVEDVVALPTLDLFPNGMNKIGDVYDEYDSEKSVQRIGIRPYQSGDESIENVLTDGTSTFYVLEEPIVTPHDYRLAYKAWDFGTEQVMAEGNTTAITAGITYEFNARDTIRSNKTRLDVLEPIVAGKIDKVADDYYPQLAVGLADNLSGVDVVDSEVNFRRSGGGAISDGVARVESIKGNSVVWNQVYKPREAVIGTRTDKGVTFTVTADGSVTAQGTSETATNASSYIQLTANQPFLSSHIYMLVAFGAPAGRWSYMGLYFGGINSINSLSMIGSQGYKIFSPQADGVASLTLSCWGGQTIDCSFKPQFYDLTKMFGAGNEPSTIEEFYARIPMGVDEYAYNEGEVIHMDVQSIESQGVNTWDEELETGRWSDTLEQWESNSVILKSKNFIQILPNAQYRITNPSGTISRYVFYDKDKQYISYVSANSNSIFTTPSNACYMMFGLGSAYKLPYNHDICINLSDTSINGKYFPYTKRVEDLSIIRKYFPNGMKSAGTAHDEIRYNKVTQKWEMVQRIGSVDMGTLNWNIDSQSRFQSTNLNATISVVSSNAYANILTYLYPTDTSSNTYNKVNDNVIAVSSDGIIKVVDSSYTDAASFKAMLQEKQVMLYYELAEPIVTELDAEDQFRDLDYQVWNCGTEKAIAEGKSAPLAADITYGFNAIGKIKELEKQMATLMTQFASLTSNNA